MGFEAALTEIELIKRSQPQNIAIQSFNAETFLTLAPGLQERLLACVRSGIENPDSAMGCYAMDAADYDDLNFFFREALMAHHGVSKNARHHSDWNLTKKCDVAQVGLPALSVRVRVGRNLVGYPLPAAMTQQDRTSLEIQMMPVFEQLNTLPGLQGTYYSLTPGHANEMDMDQYQALVDDHLMFKNMAADPYLKSAGITGDWPYGRGCYVSANRQFIIWVGEEDHLRIMSMETTTYLNSVIDGLRSVLNQIEELDGVDFAVSEKWGAITSCPTNLGTAMRASVHLPLPNLATCDEGKRLQELASSLGLAIRGAGGEHTAFGLGGMVDISPRARFCITEREIIEKLYDGILELVEHERAAG